MSPALARPDARPRSRHGWTSSGRPRCWARVSGRNRPALATALLLQSHDKVSDAEAKARADLDIRWKVALGIEVEDRPFAKSTLLVFRA